MPEPCWNIGSNNTTMDICFSNNATNTNTQQSTPLTNFWLKQIKVNLYKKQRDTKQEYFLTKHNTYLRRNSPHTQSIEIP